MSRTRDHYPRFDTTVCPDPGGCERLYHGRLEYGDSCECCGHVIGSEEGQDVMVVVPMPQSNQPGWSIQGARLHHDYMLWAPRPERDGQRARTRWSAHWDRSRDGSDGRFVQGNSAAAVLARFPDDDEGRRARRLLSAVASSGGVAP